MESPHAFVITIKGWQHHCIIYAARSRGHAKTGTWYALLEQNFKPPFRFTDIRARRLPQFDAEAQKHSGLRGPVCIGWREGGECWGVGGEKLIGIDTED
jgi:hypothetical protein